MNDLKKVEPKMQKLLGEGQVLIEEGQTSELVSERSTAIQKLWEDVNEQTRLRKEVIH